MRAMNKYAARKELILNFWPKLMNAGVAMPFTEVCCPGSENVHAARSWSKPEYRMPRPARRVPRFVRGLW